MISGISSAGMQMNMMQGPKPPSMEDKFAELDTDGSGTLNTEELEVMASEISEMTGETLTVDDLLSKMDTDGSGTLEVGEMQRPDGPPPGPPPMDGLGPRSFMSADASTAVYGAMGGDESAILETLSYSA